MVDIIDYEGLYKIAPNGTIISMPKNGRTSRVIKPIINSTGYYTVKLSKSGKRRTYLIHRLLAIHFIPNPDHLPVVNHEDGNPLNISLSNLLWCTYSENQEHAYRTGLKPSIKNKPRKTSRQVSQYDLDGNLISIHATMAAAARSVNSRPSDILRCLNNKNFIAKKYRWAYTDLVGDPKEYWSEDYRRNPPSKNLITYEGETKPLKEWCEIYGLKYNTMFNRMQRGLPFTVKDDIRKLRMIDYKGISKPLSEWCRLYALNFASLRTIICRNKYTDPSIILRRYIDNSLASIDRRKLH